MKFSFENLGFVDKGEVTLGELTLICGPNSVGKTYVSYAIYGLLYNLKQLVNIDIEPSKIAALQEHGSLTIDLAQYEDQVSKQLVEASRKFSKTLHSFFNVAEELVNKAEVNLEHDEFRLDFSHPYATTVKFGDAAALFFDKPQDVNKLTVVLQTENESNIPNRILTRTISNHIAHCLFEHYLPKPFVVTSERTGIALFYKELDTNKAAILEQLSAEKVNPIEFLNSLRSRYAQPIQHNISVVRDYDTISKRKSFIKQDKSKFKPVIDALQQLMGGSYSNVDKQLVYSPKKEKGRDKVSMPVYVASSSIKSLFLIDLYINYLAVQNGILIIDEPELNLHPDNQRKMASLLARLVNAGVKVLVTTHSDYLIREINNRVMLSGQVQDKNQIMKLNGMITQDLLKPEQLRAYSIKSDHQIHPVEIDKYGMNMEIFDDLILDANALADRIYYGIED